MRMLSPEQFLRELRNLGNKFETELFRAKQEIGNYSVSHFKSSFDRMGFAGGGNTWPERSTGGSWPLMNKTGTLKSSISWNLRRSGNGIEIFTDNKYSQYHNDSTRLNHAQGPGNYKYNIKRQFIGNSRTLETWIQRRLQKVLTDTFR